MGAYTLYDCAGREAPVGICATGSGPSTDRTGP